MKKVFPIILVVILLAVTATTAFAGKWVDAQKAPFYEVPSKTSDIVSNVITAGEVNIVDPMGNTSLIIQAKVRGLAPNTNYDFWVRDLTRFTGTNYLLRVEGSGWVYIKFFTFMTDEYGNADVHLNLRADELPDGTYTIQVAINPEGVLETVIATQWPGLNVTVKTQ